jgi:hypothetical protein
MRSVAAVRAGALLIGFLSGVNLLPAPAAAHDLDERIAELEETAARSGNRNVSLRLYGQVNRALMFWDDGKAADAYVVDNETSSTRLGLIGQATIKSGTIAGYRIEIDFNGPLSSEVSASDPGDRDGIVKLRHAYWFVEDAKLGRFTLGQQSPATDDITIINLGARMSDAAVHYNNKFELKLSPQPLARRVRPRTLSFN